MITRLLTATAACLALTLFAAPTTFAMPAGVVAPIAMGDCSGCKGDKPKGETKPAKPATSSVKADTFGDCSGCKKGDKPKGETKPAKPATS